MQKIVNRVSLGAVHTHTHTCTFRKIRRVANWATLFDVGNRLFVALYGAKNEVLEIVCFSCRRNFYTKLIPIDNLATQGGVE